MSKVASITRAGGLIVNPQHATASTTQYARGYVSEGAVVTDGLVLYLDAADYASYPGERSIATTWSDYGSHQADYDVVGDDGIILLGTYTSWAGRFPATTTATGYHTVMFDYWSDNDSVTWSIDNDGVQNNDYNTTLTANKKKQTFSKTVNLTSTGSSTMYMRPHATGSKVYVSNYRFFESGAVLNDISGKGNNGAVNGAILTVDSTAGPCINFDGTNDYITFSNDSDFDIYGSAGYAIEAWVYPTSDSESYGGIIGCTQHTSGGAGSSTINWQLYRSSGAFRMYGTADLDITTSSCANNAWWHLAVVFNSNLGLCTFYVNGAADGTDGSFTQGTIGSISPRIGRADFNYYAHVGESEFTGRMGPIRLYKNKALTAAEVKQNFNAERNRFGV